MYTTVHSKRSHCQFLPSHGKFLHVFLLLAAFKFFLNLKLVISTHIWSFKLNFPFKESGQYRIMGVGERERERSHIAKGSFQT